MMLFIIVIGTEANERLNRKNSRDQDNNNESKYNIVITIRMAISIMKLGV